MTAHPRSSPPPGRRWLPIASVTAGVGLQRGFGALLPLLLAAIATRTGGFEVAGVVGVAAAAVMLIAVAADFGVSQAAVRDFSLEPPGHREFYDLVQFKVIVGVAAGLILAAAAFFIDSGTWAAPLMVAALAIPPYSVTLLLSGKHTADGNGLTLGLAATFGFVSGAIAAVAVVAVNDAPWALLSAVAISRLVEMMLLLSGLALPRFATKGLYGVSWVIHAWPLGFLALAQMAYVRAQVIIPGAVLSAEETGQVVDGFALYSAATLVPGALSLAAWPALTRAAAESTSAAYRQAVRFSLIGLALAAVPVLVLLFVPGLLAEILFGESTSSLETYVRWGAIATLFVAVNGVMISLGLALRRDRQVVGAWAIALCISAVLIAVLSSAGGVAGAGLAVLLSEVVLTVLIGIVASPASERLGVILRRPGALAIEAACVAGAAVAGVAAVGALSPAAGYLPLLALPVVVVATIGYTGYHWLAPASIFVISWSLALGIAQLPLYPSFGWNAEAWLLLIVPPAALAAGAIVGAGRSGWQRLTLPVAFQAPPIAMQTTLAAAIVGALGWIVFFVQIGAVPLLSDQIDIARFRPFGLPTLLATRLGYVAVIIAIPSFFLSRERNERIGFAAAVAIALIPMVLSGGRLYPVSAVAIGLVATVLVRGLTLRVVLAAMAAGALVVAAASVVFFVRLDQQPGVDNEFKQHLDGELKDSRPGVLIWTIPVQVAAASSMYTLADLADTHAFEMDPSPGIYSTKFIDRVRTSGDLEEVTRTTARFSLITSTYVGPWYADFGHQGVITLSIAWGLAVGVVWRWWRTRPAPLSWLLYAYSAFWLFYAIYLNYWTVHGVWVADVAFFMALTAPSRAGVEWVRGLARRYERPAAAEPLDTRVSNQPG